jgi:hypothetical protein
VPKIDLTYPSLRALAYVLRHPELWPPGFSWDFARTGDDCGCAIPLSHHLWPDFSLLDATPGTFEAIFLAGSTQDNVLVTPAVVAGRIADHLAYRRIRYLRAGDGGRC